MQRRALLAGAAAGITSLAGCLNDADDSPTDTDSPSTDADDNTSDSNTSDKSSTDDKTSNISLEPTDGWSQFQANAAHTGATTEIGPEGGGRVRWWSDTWGAATGPVIDNETVYVGSGLRNPAVYAFERTTGNQLWRAPVEEEISRALAVHDGTVYVAANGEYALDADTGDEEWTNRVDTPWGLAVANGTVFAAAGGGGPVVALDEVTGEETWRRDMHTITTPTVAGGCVFVMGNNTLIALDAESGDTEWTETVDRAGGPPTVTDGCVVVATRNGLFAHDLATGDREWTLEGRFSNTDIATRDGKLYLAGRQGSRDEISRALAVDAATGNVEWTHDDEALHAGSTAVTAERVYIATPYRIYALDRETGAVEWWLRFEWPVGSPAICDGILYVTVGGRLMAIESGEGRAGVWQSDAEPIPDCDASPSEVSYTGTDFSFGLAGFDVSSDYDVAVDEDAPVDVSFAIEGDRINPTEQVSLTLAVTNQGTENLQFTTGAPKPFGIVQLFSADGQIAAWTPAYDESQYVSSHEGSLIVADIALETEIPLGETVSETYTISDETRGIQPGNYQFSIGETLSPAESGPSHDGWEFAVTGTVELAATDPEQGEVVHDLVVADEVTLPDAFMGGFTIDILEPVTDAHPGLIEVTFENVTGERSLVESMGDWPFGAYVGIGPDGRRLVLIPAETFGPGAVERTDTGWWELATLPHESNSFARNTTAYDPGETVSEQFIVTAHPETDAPQDGDCFAFEQGFGDDDVDVTWGFGLSTLDPTEDSGLQCENERFVRHYKGYEEDSIVWDSTENFTLTSDRQEYQYGDAAQFTLRYDGSGTYATGNRHKFNLERSTETGWEEVRGWSDGKQLPISDEEVWHEDEVAFEWTFELTESGITDVALNMHEDTLVVCPDLQAGRYRFVVWGLPDEPAVAVEFDLKRETS